MGTYPVLKNLKYPVVLFDTQCLLCNRTVQFLLKADRKNKLYFAGLSSSTGIAITEAYKITDDTVVFYSEGRCTVKSSAFISIARVLGFPYSIAVIFTIVPVRMRDAFYDYVAGRRHKWFGKTDHCIVPTKSFKERLLS